MVESSFQSEAPSNRSDLRLSHALLFVILLSGIFGLFWHFKGGEASDDPLRMALDGLLCWPFAFALLLFLQRFTGTISIGRRSMSYLALICVGEVMAYHLRFLTWVTLIGIFGVVILLCVASVLRDRGTHVAIRSGFILHAVLLELVIVLAYLRVKLAPDIGGP